MKLNKDFATEFRYALWNKNTGEIICCATLRPMYNVIRLMYRSGCWTADDNIEANHYDLITCYNCLMAHS